MGVFRVFLDLLEPLTLGRRPLKYSIYCHLHERALSVLACRYVNEVIIGGSRVSRVQACGAHLPIMDLHERALSVLACRYVNEVIIGGCI